MKRYRYIFTGTAIGKDKISDFRLIASNNIKHPYQGEVALRVTIPDDLKLIKYKCDPYSTTNDKRTLDELGYDVLIYDGYTRKWKIHNKFKGIRPCDIEVKLYRESL